MLRSAVPVVHFNYLLKSTGPGTQPLADGSEYIQQILKAGTGLLARKWPLIGLLVPREEERTELTGEHERGLNNFAEGLL